MQLINIKILNAHDFMKNVLELPSVEVKWVNEITIKIKNVTIKYIRLQKCANGACGWGTEKTINTKKRSLSMRHANIVENFYQLWLRDQLIFPNYMSYDEAINPHIEQYLVKDNDAPDRCAVPYHKEDK